MKTRIGFPAKSRFQKFVDDIARLYTDARRAQVYFAWETGRRIVQEEQNGALRAAYGSALLLEVSAALTLKYGSGFSIANLRKMRQFYLLNQKRSAPSELDWTAQVELLPVKDTKTRKQLQARILKEGLNSHRLKRGGLR